VTIVQPGSIKTQRGDAVRDAMMEDLLRPGGDFVSQRYSQLSGKLMAQRNAAEVLTGSTEATTSAFFHALLDKFPRTRYQAGVDANLAIPLLLSLPDRLRDLAIGGAFS